MAVRMAHGRLREDVVLDGPLELTPSLKTPPPEVLESGVTRLFVGGLPPDVSEAALRARFEKLSGVAIPCVQKIRDAQSGAFKGFAYVNVQGEPDCPAVRRIVDAYNNTKWKGFRMKVQVAKDHYLIRLHKDVQLAKKKEELAAARKLAAGTAVTAVPLVEETTDPASGPADQGPDSSPAPAPAPQRASDVASELPAWMIDSDTEESSWRKPKSNRREPAAASAPTRPQAPSPARRIPPAAPSHDGPAPPLPPAPTIARSRPHPSQAAGDNRTQGSAHAVDQAPPGRSKSAKARETAKLPRAPTGIAWLDSSDDEQDGNFLFSSTAPSLPRPSVRVLDDPVTSAHAPSAFPAENFALPFAPASAHTPAPTPTPTPTPTPASASASASASAAVTAAVPACPLPSKPVALAGAPAPTPPMPTPSAQILPQRVATQVPQASVSAALPSWMADSDSDDGNDNTGPYVDPDGGLAPLDDDVSEQPDDLPDPPDPKSSAARWVASDDEEEAKAKKSTTAWFDEGSDDDSDAANSNDGAAEHKRSGFLSDSDDGADDDEEADRFRLRPQFEGTAGKRLLDLQRQTADPRFRLDERFADDAAEGVNSDDEGRRGGTDEDAPAQSQQQADGAGEAASDPPSIDVKAEAARSLNILSALLGTGPARPVGPKAVENTPDGVRRGRAAAALAAATVPRTAPSSVFAASFASRNKASFVPLSASRRYDPSRPNAAELELRPSAASVASGPGPTKASRPPSPLANAERVVEAARAKKKQRVGTVAGASNEGGDKPANSTAQVGGPSEDGASTKKKKEWKVAVSSWQGMLQNAAAAGDTGFRLLGNSSSEPEPASSFKFGFGGSHPGAASASASASTLGPGLGLNAGLFGIGTSGGGDVLPGLKGATWADTAAAILAEDSNEEDGEGGEGHSEGEDGSGDGAEGGASTSDGESEATGVSARNVSDAPGKQKQKKGKGKANGDGNPASEAVAPPKMSAAMRFFSRTPGRGGGTGATDGSEGGKPGGARLQRRQLVQDYKKKLKTAKKTTLSRSRRR